ncbi:MAG: head GIN domain-containing protein [Crocinitomicaceae bacterium]
MDLKRSLKGKKNLLVVLFMVLGMGLFSCKKIDASKGDKLWFTPTVSTGFTGVEFAISGNLTYNASTTTSVEIYTTQKVYDATEFVVEDNTLKIKMKKGYSVSNGDYIQVIVNAPNVRNFINSGSGSFIANTDPQSTFTDSKVVLSGSGSITVNQLNTYTHETTLSGSGSISIAQLFCTESNLTLSGSGNVSLTGQTVDSDIVLSASGTVSSYNFISDISDVLISGSGNVQLHADSLLNVTISGSGSVYYKGYPSVNVFGSGSGSVINAN